jgi:hypothetical protein
MIMARAESHEMPPRNAPDREETGSHLLVRRWVESLFWG